MAMKKGPDLARLYHLNSSHLRHRVPDPMDEESLRPSRFRTYPGSTRVDLPGRDFELPLPVGEVLKRRRSVRDFLLKPLDLARVGRLLFASFGVRGYRRIETEWAYDRPVPSAGGLYPLEVYVATQAVEGLVDGLYHYDARAHQLEVRQGGLFLPQLADIALGQEMINRANLVIMISAVFQRMMWKYRMRGYRYVWLDAGHLGQNLYLVATALGLGPMSVGGFFDDELNQLLGLPPGEEDVIYLVCIGNQKETDGRAADEPSEPFRAP